MKIAHHDAVFTFTLCNRLNGEWFVTCQGNNVRPADLHMQEPHAFAESGNCAQTLFKHPPVN